MTPYPGMYQTVNVQEQTHKPNFAPFNALLPRFRTYSKDSYYPGYVPLFLLHFNKEQQERKYKKELHPNHALEIRNHLSLKIQPLAFHISRIIKLQSVVIHSINIYKRPRSCVGSKDFALHPSSFLGAYILESRQMRSQ